jgi:hypothetical protein
MSTIAAIRPAARHKLFAAKANTPAPAVAGDHANLYLIDKFHFGIEFRSPNSFPSSASITQKKSPERGFSVARAHDH